MSEQQIGCENEHPLEKIFLLIEGKYVKAKLSKDNGGEIKLYAEDVQDEEKSVFRFICERNGRKYVAFHFIHKKACYSLKVEGGTLKLEKQSFNLQDSDKKQFILSTDLDWFEIKNIHGGEHHYLTTANELHLSLDSKNTLGLSQDKPVKFTVLQEST